MNRAQSIFAIASWNFQVFELSGWIPIDRNDRGIDVKFQTSKQSELTRMITIVMMENLCGLFSQSKVLLSELKILSLPALDTLPE